MAEVVWREVLACLEVQEAYKLCCVSKLFNAACRGSFRRLYFQRVRGHPATFARLCATAHEVTVPRGTYVHKLGPRVHTLAGAANIPAAMRNARSLALHRWFYFAPKLLAHAASLQTLALDYTRLPPDFLTTFRQLELVSSLSLTDFYGPINNFDLADRSALRYLRLVPGGWPRAVINVTLPNHIVSVNLTVAAVLNASVPASLVDLRMSCCSWPLTKLDGLPGRQELRYRVGKEEVNVYMDERMLASCAVPEDIEHLSLHYITNKGIGYYLIDFTHKIVIPTTLRVLCLRYYPAHVDLEGFAELVNVTALKLCYCFPVLPAAFLRRLHHLCICDHSAEPSEIEAQVGQIAQDLTALRTLTFTYCSLHMPGPDFVEDMLDLFSQDVQIFRGASFLNRTLVTCKPVASPWSYVLETSRIAL